MQDRKAERPKGVTQKQQRHYKGEGTQGLLALKGAGYGEIATGNDAQFQHIGGGAAGHP